MEGRAVHGSRREQTEGQRLRAVALNLYVTSPPTRGYMTLPEGSHIRYTAYEIFTL